MAAVITAAWSGEIESSPCPIEMFAVSPPRQLSRMRLRFQALEGRMPAATGTPIGGAWPKPIAAQSSCSRGSNPSFIPIAMK